MRFARFLLAGGISAVINILSRLGLSRLMPYEVAVALAYLVGMATAFVLMRIFVFERSGRPVSGEATRFALINLVSLVQVWLVSVGLARGVFPATGFDWHPETVAHVIGVGSPVVVSYFLHKAYSFGRPGSA